MTILERIIQTKRDEVRLAKAGRPLSQLQREIEAGAVPRDFFSAVTAPSPLAPRLIAEIKKASPSAGLIVKDFDPVGIARLYHAHGAAALSVLTDEIYFQGSLDYMNSVKQAVPLPVLRKDFILEEYQVFESRAAGADAVLFIAEAVDSTTMPELIHCARDLGMTALVEVHSETNLDWVLDRLGVPGAGSYLLGINNRDLAAQITDLSTTTRLAAKLPKGTPFVAESGISSRSDVEIIRRAGASAMLVGESLLKAHDIGLKIAELLAKG